MTGCAFLPVEDAAPSKWPILGARSDRLEDAIQLAFRKRMKVVAPKCRVVAIPNAGKRGRKAIAQVKREGLAKGFPDTEILWPGGGKAYIEFKRGIATQCDVSDEQNEWLDWLQAAGFACCVSRHEDHALEFLRGVGAPFIDRTGL